VLHALPPAHALLALAAAPQRCKRGMAWEWDGVQFEVLHPAPGGAARRRNDDSCVLRVTAGGATMLLTGDIERGAEAELLGAGVLRADVLLVPHHGSRTSSTEAFLAAVRPSLAVAATGYRSRFGHPHEEVLARYAAAGIGFLRTDRDGAVTVWLAPGATQVEAYRARRARYWHVPPRPA
jgi:competence protein ComEC